MTGANLSVVTITRPFLATVTVGIVCSTIKHLELLVAISRLMKIDRVSQFEKKNQSTVKIRWKNFNLIFSIRGKD